MGVFDRLPLFSPPVARRASSARCDRLPDRRARRFSNDWRKVSRSVLVIVVPEVVCLTSPFDQPEMYDSPRLENRQERRTHRERPEGLYRPGRSLARASLAPELRDGEKLGGCV